MIELRNVSFSYPGSSHPVLRDVSVSIGVEAELLLVAGRTGCGKSTFLSLMNSLVPSFTGGELSGDVVLNGESIRGIAPRELADQIGYVPQDPASGFVTDTVEEEIAYGMEQLGLDSQTMRRRVEETLDLLGISDLRHRALRTLSGGQQQRVAMGAVLAMHPRILILDEPTSALDPTAAEEILAILSRLVDDLSLTVVLAEHRMERVVPFADRIATIVDGRVHIGDPAEILVDSPVAPTLIELGRLLKWNPLPLSIREARKRSKGLHLSPRTVETRSKHRRLLDAHGVNVHYPGVHAVKDVEMHLDAGEIMVLMGRNGSGKSSLLWALNGQKSSGTVTVNGNEIIAIDPLNVALVPQNAADLLYLETVAEECAFADLQAKAEPGSALSLLAKLAPGIDQQTHPRDLSEGQRLALVLALVLIGSPSVVALDEPTRGLDYQGKEHLATILKDLAAQGHAVIIATHDVEFAAKVADSIVVISQGEVVSRGDATTVLAQSPAFAPQTAKIFGPQWLTVDQVVAALA